jgi:YD repeat-containing protein
VASVVRSALEQAKVDQEAKAAAAAATESASPPALNPDGTVQQPSNGGNGSGAAVAPPASVTLPSTTAIRYAYIGQSVLTLQHLLDAQARRAQDAAVSTPTGLLSLPVINAERWASRHASAYVDSGTLIIASMKIHDA